MNKLGPFFRYFLNINTIWGFMILVAFLLTVYQHYAPYKSHFNPAVFQPGENTVLIKVTDKDDKVHESEFKVQNEGGKLVLAKESLQEDDFKPYLFGSGVSGALLFLQWDCKTYGTFLISVNEKAAAKGRLVTLPALTDAAFNYAKVAFDIGLGLVSTMVLFLGLMKVGEEAGLVQLAAKVFRPVILFLFPDIPANHPANGAILMNITTGVLGLGNASTPFALKAMQELQNLNPNKNIATNSMIMLLGWNTAGLALLPTTLLAVRKSAGCKDPFEVIGTCMFAGGVATIVAIIAVKILGMLPMFQMEAAVKEELAEAAAADAKKDK